MEPFSVVAACDEKFAQHTSVMLRSLLENNPKIGLRIFILVPSEFPPDIRSMITNSMPSGEYSLTFLRVCDQNLCGTLASWGRSWSGYALTAAKYAAGLGGKLNRRPSARWRRSGPIWGWVSHVTYYKLMIADLLPAEITRALYLDSDIIVRGDISDMLHLDLSQYPLAAALDEKDKWPEFKQNINLGQSIRYFNAGVMLLNLDRWRSENLGRRALEFAAAYPHQIVFWDQCALNHIIQGNFLILSKEWNFTRADVDESIARADHAKVLHFTTEHKPWLSMSNHPLNGEYWKYLQRTQWKHYVEPNKKSL